MIELATCTLLKPREKYEQEEDENKARNHV